MDIPKYVKNIIEKLEKAGYEAYIVGGCVRDLLMGANPKDWDITTIARPEEILKIFPDGKYENTFGTVLVPATHNSQLITRNDNNEAELKILSKNIKIKKEYKEKAIDIAKKYFSKIKCRAHGPQHSINVAKNSLEIANDYNDVNKDIIEIASYFHDVGRSKYDDAQHIKESQKIVKKELIKIFDKDIVNIIYDIVYHGHDVRSESLEQHILKEADLIDAVDVARCKIAREINFQEHFEYIKNKKFSDYIKTEKGVELLNENISKFNGSDFDFKLEKIENKKDIVEVTTYRSEQGYSDRRHPDEIRFEDSLEKDLSRRDFTINSLAIKFFVGTSRDLSLQKIIDLFGGQKDLDKKIIRAVGEPVDRFKEDALRMMRAIRFACQLNFSIESKTERAISKMAGGIKFIANERIKDELIKILESDKAYDGIMYLH
ncbi:MAG: HD domain-containing protein, partial [bacterium]